MPSENEMIQGIIECVTGLLPCVIVISRTPPQQPTLQPLYFLLVGSFSVSIPLFNKIFCHSPDPFHILLALGKILASGEAATMHY